MLGATRDILVGLLLGGGLLLLTGCAPEEPPPYPQVGGPRWPQVVEEQAGRYDVPVPTDEAVRVVTPPEVDQAMLQCAAEHGAAITAPTPTATMVDGHVITGGIMVDSVSPEESRRTTVACLARYPRIQDVLDPELSDQQLRVHHAWMTDEVIPCIAGLGLPVASAPTEAEFIAIYRAREPMWFPGEYDVDELQNIRAECWLLPAPSALYTDSWEDEAP